MAKFVTYIYISWGSEVIVYIMYAMYILIMKIIIIY